MRRFVFIGLIAAAQLGGASMASPSFAETASLEAETIGGPPRGWLLTMTGKGVPKWTVERDEGGGAVLKQSGKATYPLALKEHTNIRDGFAEVKFKPISGSEDRAGGVVSRAKDANNYYVVRASALEDNVVLYKTVNGTRSSLGLVGKKGGYRVKTAVPASQWHTLRDEFAGPASTSSSTAAHCSRSRMPPSRNPAWWAFGQRPIALPCFAASPTVSDARTCHLRLHERTGA
jgi:hypothetical protein